MKGEDVFIETNYEVIRFVEHGNRCRPAMDYVSGELLIYRLKRYPEVEKKVLFEWMKQLLCQLELYHRCCNGQCYRYLNPYSVLVTKENRLLLLDLGAESNDFVLKNMQKRSMRNHFVKPIVHIRENTKLSLDLYGFGKTIQFILANTKVEPSLTRREEYQLSKVIKKCLGENPKKQYKDFKQVQKELPKVPNKTYSRKSARIIRLYAAAGIFILLLSILLIVWQGKKEKVNPEEISEQKQLEATEEKGSIENQKDGMDILKEETEGLQEYLLRNTTKDNREIIETGERLYQELLRYLSAAYDREGMTEEALASYELLCDVETQTELVKSAYLRRISLEMEIQDKTAAIQTAKEAVGKFPELKESEVLKKMEEKYGTLEKEDVNEEKNNFMDQ